MNKINEPIKRFLDVLKTDLNKTLGPIYRVTLIQNCNYLLDDILFLKIEKVVTKNTWRDLCIVWMDGEYIYVEKSLNSSPKFEYKPAVGKFLLADPNQFDLNNIVDCVDTHFK